MCPKILPDAFVWKVWKVCKIYEMAQMQNFGRDGNGNVIDSFS